MSQQTLDIIVPCYNPPTAWASSVVRSYQKLSGLMPTVALRLIIVNDGSNNGKVKNEIDHFLQKIPNAIYVELKSNQGKGFAIKEGLKYSDTPFVAFTDIDFPYEEENIVAMYQQLQLGADIVIGSRNQQYYKKVPWFRKWLSKFFKEVIKIILRIPTTDTQAGLKAFSLKGKQIALQAETNRYLFDLELVKRAHKASLQFAYVPLNLKDNIVLSKMTWTILWKEFKNLRNILWAK